MLNLSETCLFFFRTSGENIGDTGLIQAYRAWKAQYEESYEAGNEYLLPGLNYTRCVHYTQRWTFKLKVRSEQLFFISFARIWARNMKPQEAVSMCHEKSLLIDDIQKKKGAADSNRSALANTLSCRWNSVQHSRVCKSVRMFRKSKGLFLLFAIEVTDWNILVKPASGETMYLLVVNSMN